MNFAELPLDLSAKAIDLSKKQPLETQAPSPRNDPVNSTRSLPQALLGLPEKPATDQTGPSVGRRTKTAPKRLMDNESQENGHASKRRRAEGPVTPASPSARNSIFTLSREPDAIPKSPRKVSGNAHQDTLCDSPGDVTPPQKPDKAESGKRPFGCGPFISTPPDQNTFETRARWVLKHLTARLPAETTLCLDSIKHPGMTVTTGPQGFTVQPSQGSSAAADTLQVEMRRGTDGEKPGGSIYWDPIAITHNGRAVHFKSPRSAEIFTLLCHMTAMPLTQNPPATA